MSGSGANNQPILEIDLEIALCGLGLTFEQFVDLCILCGCDYCSSIKGIGPKTALKLIRQYKNLEGIIQFVKRDRKKKYQLPKDWTAFRLKAEPKVEEIQSVVEESSVILPPPAVDSAAETISPALQSENAAQHLKQSIDMTHEGLSDEDDAQFCLSEEEEVMEENDEEDPIDNEVIEEENLEEDIDRNREEEDEEGELIEPMYIQARHLFANHEVISAADVELKWLPPQEEELRRFLVERMGFNAERVENGIKKLVEAQGKKAQQRLDRSLSFHSTL
jgi:5'-3' exonuclease